MKKRCVLIINPVSGGFSEKKLNYAVTALEQHGHATTVLFTKAGGDAESMSRDIAANKKADIIVAGGGDGTINEVVNGMVFSDIPLGIMPFGSAGVLAKELGIYSLDEAAERISRGFVRHITLGRIEKGDRQRYFVLMAGIGLDGAVVRRVSFKGYGLFKKAVFVIAGLRELFLMDRSMITLVNNGKETQCHSVMICNATKYAGNFILAPQTNLFVPHLQAVYVKKGSIPGYLMFAAALSVKRHLWLGNVGTATAERFEVRGEKPVQIDGEFFGYSPCVLTAAENALDLIV